MSLTKPSRRELTAIGAITAAFVAVCAFWALLTPIYQAPDEHAHLNSSIRLTDGLCWPDPGDADMYAIVLEARDEGSVPRTERSTFDELAQRAGAVDADLCANESGSGLDQMTQHPPLYYAFGAAVLEAIDFMSLRHDLALLALRLASVLFAVPLPILVWNSIRRVTRSGRAGLVGAFALLMVPQLGQVLGAVQNDGLTILLCSTSLWLAIRVMTGDERRRILVATGVALGLALLVKGTAIPAVVAVAAILLIWPRHAAVRVRVVRAFAALAVAFAVGGWWWLRNLIVYRSLQPNGLSRPTVEWEPGTYPDPVQYLDLVWRNMSLRFWGEFGLLDHPLPQVLTDALSVVAILVVVAFAFRHGRTRLESIVLGALPGTLLLMLLANTWPDYMRTQMPGGLQGRYFYVAIVALLVVSAIAWLRAVPSMQRPLAGRVIIAVSAAMALIGLWRHYIGVYEGSFYRVSIDGVRHMLAYSPGGAAIPWAGAIMLIALAAAAVLGWRACSHQRIGGAVAAGR